MFGNLRMKINKYRLSTTKLFTFCIALFIIILFTLVSVPFLYPDAPLLLPPGKDKYHNFYDNNIGDCLQNYFEDILLIITYHFPFYDSIPLLTSFYKDAFPNIIFCGPKSYMKSFVLKVDVGPGLYGYQCATEAIRKYPGFRGYLYINDDMVVNWWNFASLDKEKFWQGDRIIMDHAYLMGTQPIPRDWPWWNIKSKSAEACEQSYFDIITMNNDLVDTTKLQMIHRQNGDGKKLCFRQWSDLFYIPQQYTKHFILFSDIFFRNHVFLEVAVPTIMSFIDIHKNIEQHLGTYLPDKYGSINFADGKLVWKEYNTELNFIHPVKFHGAIAKNNRHKLMHEILPFSKKFMKCPNNDTATKYSTNM